jgi:hypothetical protein
MPACADTDDAVTTLMASELQQHAAAAHSRWRIGIDGRADVVFPLRDYFRRLGVPAEVCGPTTIELTTEVPLGELRTRLGDWVRVMDVRADFVETKTVVAPVERRLIDAPTPRLGELLVKKGFLTDEQLRLGLQEARDTKELLGVVLLRKKMIFEDELARTLSEQLTIPYLGIRRIGVNPFVARLVPIEVGERVAAIPVRADGDLVQVAFADPTDPVAVEAINEHLPRIQVAVAELSDIKEAWRKVRSMRAG